MQFLIIIAGFVLSVTAYEPITIDYHERIGIPKAARIKAAEDAQDFAGARIVGGDVSALGTHPYVAGLIIDLVDGRTSICAATLLSKTRLVTAAHCWKSRSNEARQFTVVLGSVNLYSGGVRIVTNDVEPHADYDPMNLNNDIAIIKIPAVTFTGNIESIDFDAGSNSHMRRWGLVIGFGRTSDSSSDDNLVQKHAVLQVVPNAECERVYGSATVTDNTMCTTTINSMSPCVGDSGGPLILGSTTLMGIISFYPENCAQHLPVGYTRVNSYASWIKARL